MIANNLSPKNTQSKSKNKESLNITDQINIFDEKNFFPQTEENNDFETLTYDENGSIKSENIEQTNSNPNSSLSSIYSLVRTNNKYLEEVKNIENKKNIEDLNKFETNLVHDAEQSIYSSSKFIKTHQLNHSNLATNLLENIQDEKEHSINFHNDKHLSIDIGNEDLDFIKNNHLILEKNKDLNQYDHEEVFSKESNLMTRKKLRIRSTENIYNQI